ncbi:glycosyltransferase [Flexivirga sp. ID2601S]|uniref:D-inositol 3-phosphate glycosyltransferase n=1 Tax=Flexivirga aerilata TaxID=1656889 RepID=A0A849AP38_9MICO|nr:glycosyltransferase [Flexivirga aerilata]NNG40090.1 glycosyltransferase [Flexivirga aerilata]
MTRVALLFHTPQLGGAELGSARMLRALPDDVTVECVVLGDGPLVDLLRADGHRVHVVPADDALVARTREQTSRVRAVTGAFRALPTVCRVTRLIRRLDVDVVSSTSLKSALLSVPVARLTCLPLVWHLHDRIAPDYLPRHLVRLVRALARWAPKVVVANSAASARTLPGVRSLVVVHPGLEPEQIADDPRPTPSGAPVIGMVGRLSETKGQRELVQALPAVLAAHPRARLRLVGSAMFGQDGYEEELRAEVDALGLTDTVSFTGQVEADDIPAALAGFSVAVHASPVPEPFGQVVTEAMAQGVPVVATAAGGTLEIVAPTDVAFDRPLGLLTPPGNVPALADAMIAVLDDRQDAERRARRAHDYVQRRFTIQRSADQLAEVWRGAATRGRPPVAIGHDYVTQRGGAEHVAMAIAEAFPGAPVHTMLYEPSGSFPGFRSLPMRAGALNRVRTFREHHRRSSPFLPFVAPLTRVDADVSVLSTSGWAHAFRVSGRSVVYCHSPARWLYQTGAYFGGLSWKSPMTLSLLAFRPILRRWDRWAAQRADRYVVNSRAVQAEVRAIYGIDAEVLSPPYGVDPEGVRSRPDGVDGEFFLLVSRLMPYKHVDRVVEAFRGTPYRLVIVGAGPERAAIEQLLPANVTLLSDIDDAQLRWLYAAARALVAASLEDFGLTPVEAAVFGTPTIALRARGYLDTVVEGETGLFFDEPTPAAIASAVQRALAVDWDEERIRRHAEQFSPQTFAARMRALVDDLGRSAPA